MSQKVIKSALLSEIDADLSLSDISTVSSGYHIGNLTLLSADMRQDKKVRDELLRNGFEQDVQTLVLSECVLVYISKEAAGRLVEWSLFFSLSRF